MGYISCGWETQETARYKSKNHGLGGRFSKQLDISVKIMDCIDIPGFTVTFSWNNSCESTVNSDFCVKYTAKIESGKMVLKWLTCQDIMIKNLE